MNDDIQKYRYEIKFVVLPHYYHEIIAWIRSSVYGFCEHYRDRTISNIYFDNNDYDSFFSNVTGLSKRVKVRYRWYDEPHAIKSGNLEVKVKNNKLGYKKSAPVVLEDIGLTDVYTINSVISDCISINPEVGCFFDSYSMPTIVNSYRREYYQAVDGVIRLTIDRDYSVFDQKSATVLNLSDSTMLNFIIVELKFPYNSYSQASKIISDFPARHSRHSKYVSGLSILNGY